MINLASVIWTGGKLRGYTCRLDCLVNINKNYDK